VHTSRPAKDSTAPIAHGRQRGEGSRPSGKTQAIAVTPANSSGQERSESRIAQSPPGSEPGWPSTAYSPYAPPNPTAATTAPFASSSQPMRFSLRRRATSRPKPVDTSTATDHTNAKASPEP
jgi:hypothetical protein